MVRVYIRSMNTTSTSRRDAPFLPPDRESLQRQRRRAFSETIRLRMIGGRAPETALAMAEQYEPRVGRLVKASVPALVVGDDALVNEFQQSAAAWLESLSQASAFDAALPAMKQVQPYLRVGIITEALVAYSVDEGAGKPAARLVIDASDPLTPHKAAALTVATNEFLRTPGARDMLNGELQTAVSFATDSIFLSELVGLTSPIASVSPSVDFAALLAAVTLHANSRLFWVMRPADLAHIAAGGSATWGASLTVSGGTTAGVTVIPSDVPAEGTSVMFDASQIAADGGTLRIEASSQTSIQMSDSPTIQTLGGSPSAPVAANLTSMFQTSSTACLVERIFAFKMLRDTAVASISGINYAGGSP